MDFKCRLEKVANEFGSARKLGIATNISGSSIGKYISGDADPSRKRLLKIAEVANVNIMRLLTGEGPMRPGDQIAAPQEHSPPCATNKEAYLKKAQDPSQPIDDNIGLGQAVELLAKIFGSNNHILMRAIIANLQAFGEAIDNKNKELQARAEMEQMQIRMDAMEKQMNALLKKINDMESAQTSADQGDDRQVANGH